jgi:hypothetical protein
MMQTGTDTARIPESESRFPVRSTMTDHVHTDFDRSYTGTDIAED